MIMRPNHRDIVESIRREHVAEMAETQVDTDALLALAPPCSWDRHATGETGCEPGAPAEFVIRVREHCGPPMPTITLICQAQQMRIWRHRDQPFECGCGRLTSLGQLIDFLGRVDEYYP